MFTPALNPRVRALRLCNCSLSETVEHDLRGLVCLFFLIVVVHFV